MHNVWSSLTDIRNVLVLRARFQSSARYWSRSTQAIALGTIPPHKVDCQHYLWEYQGLRAYKDRQLGKRSTSQRPCLFRVHPTGNPQHRKAVLDSLLDFTKNSNFLDFLSPLAPSIPFLCFLFISFPLLPRLWWLRARDVALLFY